MKAVDKELRQLFSTPMFVAKLDSTDICDQTVAELEKLKSAGTGHNNDFAWTTDDNLHTLPQFKNLTEFLYNEAGEVLDVMGIKRRFHEITCMWANVAEVGHQHIIHAHSNSFLSGLLYLQAPEGSGATVFMDPRPASVMWDPDYLDKELFRTAYISNKAEKGVLVFFPSWLTHGVDVGRKRPEEKRIVLSFNVMIRGPMTQHSKKLDL
jgi:uncharacterized protein (TIGR02466 family)